MQHAAVTAVLAALLVLSVMPAEAGGFGAAQGIRGAVVATVAAIGLNREADYGYTELASQPGEYLLIGARPNPGAAAGDIYIVGGEGATGGDVWIYGAANTTTASSTYVDASPGPGGAHGSVMIGSQTGYTSTIQVGRGNAPSLLIYGRERASDPNAPSTDCGVLYFRDSGGKTQLCVRFATGAVQVLATEP